MIMPDDKCHGPPSGSWCVSLSLQESSPSTWFEGQLSLPNSNRPLRLRSKQMMEGLRNEIVVPMDNSPDFGTLQYSYVPPSTCWFEFDVLFSIRGNMFNPEDEQLTLSLEAKLRKSDSFFDN